MPTYKLPYFLGLINTFSPQYDTHYYLIYNAQTAVPLVKKHAENDDSGKRQGK